MIDLQLLNKENGFVEGCVVEIRCEEVDSFGDFYHGFFKGVRDGFVVYETEGGEILSEIWHEHIVNIRPLTGPMAIWNFAPEWATYCGVNAEDGCIEWSNGFGPAFTGAITTRPFWAPKKA